MNERISDNFGRIKGATWFHNILHREVLIVGCGGISSWLSILLARVGLNLYIYDHDRIESHNLNGQLFKNSDVGKLKVEATKSIIREFCDSSIEVEVFPERYTKDSPCSAIVLTGLDNMLARRISFENWIEFLKNNPEEKEEAIFIDGRLAFEKLQIFCIKGNDVETQEKYIKDFLFNDSEVEEIQCTAKSTSHVATMIASLICGFLVNFFGEDFRDVPFYYEYNIPLNLTNNNPD